MFEQQKIIAAAQAVRDAVDAYDRVISGPYSDTSFKVNLPDRRYHRTAAVVAHIMQIVGPYLCEHGEAKSHRDVHKKLFASLFDAGIEVLTDQDRAELGLAPRDPRGWTAEEIQAADARHLEAMLRPLPPVIMPRAG